ncbi:hypothetical protein HPB51_023117 [Rhipicephalus microplus]|uniref:Uncharacterized protein n=1 Tax=Rhipicephalus microplus TaxID=6941 RepID=A0A9J6DJE4_RHIMP|nr:hypothetical protein HPB51_023117 [Rhipicephalus microplus]
MDNSKKRDFRARKFASKNKYQGRRRKPKRKAAVEECEPRATRPNQGSGDTAACGNFDEIDAAIKFISASEKKIEQFESERTKSVCGSVSGVFCDIGALTSMVSRAVCPTCHTAGLVVRDTASKRKGLSSFLELHCDNSECPESVVSAAHSSRRVLPERQPTDAGDDWSYRSGSSRDSFAVNVKVKSYFSPSEDDAEAFIKPVRAYSIGSRQQVKKTSLAGHLDQSRVRAYSVGSQVAPTAMRRRLKKDADVDANALQRLEGQKSSSVPTLQEDASSSQQAPRALNYNEDLMEINYDRSDLGQGSSSTPVVEKSSVLPPASMKQPETSEAIRKLSTASTPSTTKTFDDYMVMTTGSESGAGSSSSYQHSLTSPTGSEHTERKVSVPSSSRQRKEDLGKENHPGGRSSSYTGMIRRSSTTQQALREDNAVSMSSSLPSNGLNQCKTDSEYVATEMTKKGVAFLGTSNGTVSKGKPGSSYHVLPMTTTSLRPASPESQQLGEYVNLDLSKTMKWTQHVKMPVSSSGDSTPMTSSANGSSFWSSGPKLPAEGSTSVTRVAPLAVAESSYVQLRGLADPPPAATVLQQVPPEANYENISLKGGAATVVEAPAERVLNYASLDLAPPSGEDGAPTSLALPSRHESTQVHRLAGVEDSTYMYRMGIKGVDL